MRPEYLDREARLKLMEVQGVERAVVFPSAMALSVENYVKNVPAVYANIGSFNRWFDEEWGFGRDGKIFAPALLSLADRDLAVAELDFVLNQGARIILLPTGPAYGRSPGDPYFDPIWARMNEAGATVAFHISLPIPAATGRQMRRDVQRMADLTGPRGVVSTWIGVFHDQDHPDWARGMLDFAARPGHVLRPGR